MKMQFPFSSELISSVMHTILGAILAGILFYYKRVKLFYRTRNVRKFWKPFINQPITFVLTEYPISGKDRLSKIAKMASSGWLISKGMAFALANLLDFCENKITSNKDICIIGDRTGKSQTSNLLILGSPINNTFSKLFFEKITKMYDIPFKIVQKDESSPIEIHIDQTVFTPSLEKGNGEDFALVIKCAYQKIPVKSVLLIAGCYMWGTEAAAMSITDTNILNTIKKETRKADNVAFIVRNRIVNDNILGPEIEIDSIKYIKALNFKASH